MKPTTYSVYYRTGGTDNFKWQKVLDSFNSYPEARVKADELQRAGYKALIGEADSLERIGLPKTFE